jgi:hypothetical protein
MGFRQIFDFQFEAYAKSERALYLNSILFDAELFSQLFPRCDTRKPFFLENVFEAIKLFVGEESSFAPLTTS